MSVTHAATSKPVHSLLLIAALSLALSAAALAEDITINTNNGQLDAAWPATPTATSGDNPSVTNQNDIKNVWVVKDATYIYFRMETWASPACDNTAMVTGAIDCDRDGNAEEADDRLVNYNPNSDYLFMTTGTKQMVYAPESPPSPWGERIAGNIEWRIEWSALPPECRGAVNIGWATVHATQYTTIDVVGLVLFNSPDTAAGRLPGDLNLPGTPLLVTRAGADLTLSWDVSCLTTDNDYAVYEGVLGDYASHAPVACTTGGATSLTFTPGADGRYYLVVPRNATREGAYGQRSDGTERAASAAACAVQLIGVCP